mgnify:CR=1 FL=1
MLLLQMKLIRKIDDLNKALQKDQKIGFVPTMGGLHKGHESLIMVSKKKCKKTLVSIFVNPTQFNNKNDYISYPRNINKDLKILKRLNVDFVFLPSETSILRKKSEKFQLKKSQKILCAKFRKGHFEGVLDIMNRFTKLILPKNIFMGEKDYQQFFLVKKMIQKKFITKVFSCKTIRSNDSIALSSRNHLLNKNNLKVVSSITKKLIKLKRSISINKRNKKILIKKIKNDILHNYDVKIDYLEVRNTLDLKTDILNKKYRIFIAYHINGIRLIDNL